MTLKQLALFARYNRVMNERVLAACAQLDADALCAPRGAFFGSILGTLNHLIVADTIWLKRFANLPGSAAAALAPVVALPAPQQLDVQPCADLSQWQTRRVLLDEAIEAWIVALSETELAAVLDYRNIKGIAARRRLSDLLMHFFNHQTHHRGQVSTLLFQLGIDIGVTDLAAMIPEEAS